MRWQFFLVAPPHRSATVLDLAPIEPQRHAPAREFERRRKHPRVRLADRLHHLVFGLRVPRRSHFPRQWTRVRVRHADDRRLHAVLLPSQIAHSRRHERSQIARHDGQRFIARFEQHHRCIQRIVRARSISLSCRVAAHYVTSGRRDVDTRHPRSEIGCGQRQQPSRERDGESHVYIIVETRALLISWLSKNLPSIPG